MLKLRIEKSAWEKLTPAVQELYTADGDEYALGVEGADDDNGPLKRALERTKADLKDERAEKRKLSTKLDALDALDENDARKRGDIDKLTQQWEDKLQASDEAHADEVAKLREHISTTTIDSIVASVAGANTGTKENAALLDPHIRQQLSVEFTDDGPQIMMEAAGGAVPLNLDKFEKTVVDNPAFAAIIVGNRASGGGASDNQNLSPTGGAFPTDATGQPSTPIDLATLDPANLAKMLSKS